MAEEELVHLDCMVCGKLLGLGQDKYCGYKCSGVGRTKNIAPECQKPGCGNLVGLNKHFRRRPNQDKWRTYCSRECFYSMGRRTSNTCSRGHEKVYAKTVETPNGPRDRYHCPDCRRATRYARVYGMTIEEALEFEPPEACEICGKEVKLVIDHNHETGQFRGSLCGNCNSGLGQFFDDPKLLKKAFYYLKDRGYYG